MLDLVHYVLQIVIESLWDILCISMYMDVLDICIHTYMQHVCVYIYIYICRVSQELRSLLQDLIPELILGQKCHKHMGPIHNCSGFKSF